jgi:exodeoxyribonuclease-3
MPTIKLISWNVNGLRAIQRKGAFDWFLQVQPDIFCLQETKAQKEQLDTELTDVDGYEAHFISAERKGYSGVATYTRLKPVSVESGLGIERFDTEGRVAIAHFEAFTLMNIYYPNGKSSPERLAFKMDFYDAFLDYAERLKSAGKKLVICGDVNTAHREIDLARPKPNETVSGFLPEERAWIDKFLAHGYHDTFRMFNSEPNQYTWWDLVTRARERNVGWRIDYFYVSDNLKNQVKSASILADVQGSDHCPIGLELEI